MFEPDLVIVEGGSKSSIKIFYEKKMTEKLRAELNLLASPTAMPTIEVDIDSVDEGTLQQAIVNCLIGLASADAHLHATVYSYATPSFNFHEATNSVFYGVVGKPAVLTRLESLVTSIPGIRARFSDYISVRDSIEFCHVEDGAVWQPLDSVTWYAADIGEEHVEGGRDKTADDELEETEVTDLDIPDDTDGPVIRASNPTRFRAARSDAHVGSIKRQIERVFGLPEGSVALCGPDGGALRSDALIATLRRRWE